MIGGYNSNGEYNLHHPPPKEIGFFRSLFILDYGETWSGVIVQVLGVVLLMLTVAFLALLL